MELIKHSVAGVICLVTFWILAGPPRKKPQILNINGRKFEIIGVVDGNHLKIRRTFGQWAVDKWHGARRFIRIALACIGVGACGGAEFSLTPNQTDAGTYATPDAGRVSYVDPYVDPPIEAGPDARLGFKLDAGAPDARDAQTADVPDACFEPSWQCGTTSILPGRFCLNYAGRTTQQNIPAACSVCGPTCACIEANTTCGIFDGVLYHTAGCVEASPNEIEVTCQP